MGCAGAFRMPNLRPEKSPDAKSTPAKFPGGTRTMSIQRFKIGPRMSQAVVHNDTVYLAGQVADDTTADVKGQTAQILNQIDELLALVGSDKSKLLSATVYLSDMAHFGAMNASWEAWIDPANPPVRATVEAKLAAPKYQVEIAIIAAK
jgi:enamine deaminase RidA (YjgF/YER057c/UK114 family)